MHTLAALIAGAAVALAASRALRLPSIPLLLVAGIALGGSGLVQRDGLGDGVVLGVTFLLFVGGLELSPQRVGRQRGAALRIGAAQFLLLGLLGFGAARLIGFSTLASLYLALALTASSTLVVMQVLRERAQTFEPFGRLLLGVLLLQDVLIILLIPVVAEWPAGAAAVLRGLGGTLLLIAAAWAVSRWLTPALLGLRDDEEPLLLVILAILFVFVGLANALGVPIVAGAFLGGVALSAFPLGGIVRGQLGSITDFFTAIFFTALGGFLVVPQPVELLQALVFATVILVFTTPLVAIVAERAGFSAKPAIETGLLLSQTSELSLVVALQGMAAGHISPGTFTVVALVTALTMLWTPFLATDRVTRSLLRLHPVRGETLLRGTPSDHVLVVGCGAAGLPLLETLLASGHDIVVIDDDPAIIARLREGEVPCVRGDASDPDVLRSAGADRARIITSTVRRPRDNRALLEAAAGVPVIVRVFEDDDAEWVRRHGGTPVLSSAAATEAFMAWHADQKAAAPAA